MTNINVVVPIYNVASYLENSIGSLMAQTLQDFKAILVNDGSSDNSLQIAQNLVGDDKRFIIVSKPNGGLSSARNYGLKYVDSKYVYFFDSDDTLEKTLLEKCVNKLEQDDSDMVIFDYNQYWVNRDYKEHIKNYYDQDCITSLKLDSSLMIHIANAAWNKVYKTSLFIDNNIRYPNGHIYEDLGTTYRLLLHCNKVSFIREPLYNYIVDRSGNITSSINLLKARDILFNCQYNISYYKKNNCFDKYYEQLKYLSGINIVETLRKCNQIPYNSEVKAFVKQCFNFLKENFNEYPNCIYNLNVRKDDWIYLHQSSCLLYLMLRNKIKGNV